MSILLQPFPFAQLCFPATEQSNEIACQSLPLSILSLSVGLAYRCFLITTSRARPTQAMSALVWSGVCSLALSHSLWFPFHGERKSVASRCSEQPVSDIECVTSWKSGRARVWTGEQRRRYLGTFQHASPAWSILACKYMAYQGASWRLSNAQYKVDEEGRCVCQGGFWSIRMVKKG